MRRSSRNRASVLRLLPMVRKRGLVEGLEDGVLAGGGVDLEEGQVALEELAHRLVADVALEAADDQGAGLGAVVGGGDGGGLEEAQQAGEGLLLAVVVGGGGEG